MFTCILYVFNDCQFVYSVHTAITQFVGNLPNQGYAQAANLPLGYGCIDIHFGLLGGVELPAVVTQGNHEPLIR